MHTVSKVIQRARSVPQRCGVLDGWGRFEPNSCQAVAVQVYPVASVWLLASKATLSLGMFKSHFAC